MKIDVLVDLQFGDCGKGKVSKWLLERNNYWAVAKYNGGPNAGHAVWINGIKYTSHMLTSGIYGDNSKIIIGPGCVLNIEKFFKELEDFKGFNIKGRVFIHPNTHIITKNHIELDSTDSKIGTTKQGVGPAYADKMLRQGYRAQDFEELESFIITPELINPRLKVSMLMEGSQGWWLDIDNGFYPYVTSSNIHPAHAFSTFGLPLQCLNRIYGVAKVYETYVGASTTMVSSSQEDGDLIRKVGNEYGETTGRPRQVGYLNLPRLIKAIQATGTTVVILNKLDVLEKVGIFKLFRYFNDTPQEFKDVDSFKRVIRTEILNECNHVIDVIFSGSKETV